MAEPKKYDFIENAAINPLEKCIQHFFVLPLYSNSIQLPKPSVERSTAQAEEMRQQRNQEVRQLIGSSVDKAKAIFAQNTAAGQLSSKSTKTAPVKPVRNSITRSTTTNNQQQQSPEPEKSHQLPEPDDIHDEIETSSVTNNSPSNHNLQETAVAEQSLEDDDSDPYSTIKRSPYSKVTTNSQNDTNGGNSKQADHVQTKSASPQKVAVRPAEDDEPPISDAGKLQF